MAIGAGSAVSAARGDDRVYYNRDVRPILAENCFACHGPDSASRKAGLRLDRREAAIKAGAIAPGKPDESEAINRVFADNPRELMPPPASHKKLTADQKNLLRRWVATGAEYQPHWSLIVPVRPKPPAVQGGWARNPIDSFVLAALERRGLRPAPEADRRTLARRASLDLTGLPPSLADVEAFVRDTSPQAYEGYVDRLLASNRWGEHRARYWLDAARYADTHGIHFDNYREMWSYRDWVIDAFGRNMPFDRFTIEQLAGDMLPGASLDQKVASGFNRCNITTNEGGVIAEEYIVLYARDRTETTARVWLGLTANCAVCHDHKFDPLTQKEFYQLSAFFNNTTQGAMDGNVKDTAPTLFVPAAADRARWTALAQEVARAKADAEGRKTAARADFDKWLATAAVQDLSKGIPADGLRLHAPLDEGKGDAFMASVAGKPQSVKLAKGTAWAPGHVAAQALAIRTAPAPEMPEAGDFEHDKPFSYGAWVRLGEKSTSGAIFARMDDRNAYRGWDLWVEGGKPGAHIIHRWPENALKVVSNTPLKPNEWHHLLVTYDGSRQAAGVRVFVDGQPQATSVQSNALKSTIRTTVPLKFAQRHTSSRLDDLTLADVRLYGRLLSEAEVRQLARSSRAAWLAAKPAAQRSDAERNELFDGWLPEHDKPYREFTARAAALEAEQAAIRSRGTAAHVMDERKSAPGAHFLYRGEYDKRRDAVKAETPAMLPAMPAQLPKNRLGLAQWLLRPDQPLTARVAVNRFWQEVFGVGLVKTAEDFGINGELPSHPELLDWLAVEFRESGWDVKRLFRLMVTSAAYRQAAVATPEKIERDPQNRFLSRGPRFRMDAEMVRDYALAASGLLSPKIGGPSVKPYQPDGVWDAVAMMESNTRNYQRDNGESLYRRSLYTFWKRAAPPASMDVFNAPSRETCTVRRERTNTPLQALVTLNDPQFVEAARRFAETALQQGGATSQSRLDYVAGRLLARSLRPEETRIATASLETLLAHYRAHPKDAESLVAVGESKADPALDKPSLAGWTMLINELMNLDEVLNK